MNDLHLTDEQINELKTIKPMGLAAAYELLYWRKAKGPTWRSVQMDDGTTAIRLRASSDLFKSLWQNMEDDAAAICFSRNTAELRAAAIYWTTQKFKHPGGERHIVSNRKLAAIAEALESLCQGAPAT